MTVRELAEKLGLKIFTKEAGLDKAVNSVYIGDLLSSVMSSTDKGDVWITIHTHINTVAVAALNELSCIILAESLEPEKNTLEKAMEVDVPILGTDLSAYKIACRMHDLEL
ncbi:MAG TPA: AraC family transcriptional regulator [Clostridiaceae bacterium]|jgi:predicted transcriptional regulator|nr:AraC family transcriptional regulator [Clostridiaceae bacterium]